MSIRSAINNNSGMVAAVAVVLLLAAVAIFMLRNQGGAAGATDLSYYFDPQTERFFIADRWMYPPVETPTTEESGLRAHIYACGSCPGDIEEMTLDELRQTNAFVSHFERYTDEALQTLAGTDPREVEGDPDADPAQLDALEGGLVIRSADATDWVLSDSPTAEQIGEAAFTRCDDQPGDLSICRP